MYRLALMATAAVASPAGASSPSAWRLLEAQATRSCIQASSLKRPRVSNPVIFDDNVRFVALLVTGTFPQAHMKGRIGTDLCLFDRRSKKAFVEEAPGWRGRP